MKHGSLDVTARLLASRCHLAVVAAVQASAQKDAAGNCCSNCISARARSLWLRRKPVLLAAVTTRLADQQSCVTWTAQ
jgi:hypothetical protein